MTSAKAHIIQTSIDLFNEKGFFNVSIQEIARALKMSPGNLTYHFPKKEDLLNVIQQEIIDYPTTPIMPKGQYLTLEHLEIIFRQFFEVQEKFSFFFANLQYLHYEYPDIIQEYKTVSLSRLEQAGMLVDYYVHTGRLKPARDKIHHEALIRNLWVSNTFWKLQSNLLGGSTTYATAMDHIWKTIMPYLTDRGYVEYLEINTIQSQKLINENGGT